MNIKHILSLTSVALLAGMAAHAEAHGPSQEQIDALVAAIEANGCVINGETADAILAASALEGSVAESVLDALGEAGEAADATIKLTRAEDGSLTLTSPNCGS